MFSDIRLISRKDIFYTIVLIFLMILVIAFEVLKHEVCCLETWEELLVDVLIVILMKKEIYTFGSYILFSEIEYDTWNEPMGK